MKTIAKFTKPEEAHLLAGRLQSAGIEAFVTHEHTTQLYGSLLDLIKARVQVADEDEEEAKAFIAADTP